MQSASLTVTDGKAPQLVRGAGKRTRLTRTGIWWVCALAIFCATLLSKVSVPPFGALGISITLFLLPLVACLGFAGRTLSIEPVRLALFLSLTGLLAVISLFGAAEFSVSSMAMFTVVHLPFIFAARQANGPKALRRDYQEGTASTAIHTFFLNLCLVVGVCGIAQFFLQAVIPVRFLFPIENFVPASLVTQHFNSQGVLEYGSETYRANGVFLPEPSYFSQLMGIAIVLELCMLSRWWRLAAYGVALLTAGAGTGLMIVGLCVPLIIVKRGRLDLLLVGAAAIAAVGALGESTYVGHLASRAGEFNAMGSSAFARFIGGFYLFDQFQWDDPWRTLFGFGAGSFTDYAKRAHYAVAEMPLFKMVLEFGLLGSLAYFLTLGYFLFSSRAPRILSLAIAIAFLLNGIYAVFAQALTLGLLLWPFPSAPRIAWRAGTTALDPVDTVQTHSRPPAHPSFDGQGVASV
jgi:hypothetical protein